MLCTHTFNKWMITNTIHTLHVMPLSNILQTAAKVVPLMWDIHFIYSDVYFCKTVFTVQIVHKSFFTLSILFFICRSCACQNLWLFTVEVNFSTQSDVCHEDLAAKDDTLSLLRTQLMKASGRMQNSYEQNAIYKFFFKQILCGALGTDSVCVNSQQKLPKFNVVIRSLIYSSTVPVH